MRGLLGVCSTAEPWLQRKAVAGSDCRLQHHHPRKSSFYQDESHVGTVSFYGTRLQIKGKDSCNYFISSKLRISLGLLINYHSNSCHSAVPFYLGIT